MKQVSFQYINSPLGALLCMADENGICLLHFEGETNESNEEHLKNVASKYNWTLKNDATDLLDTLGQQLGAYFKGQLKDFTVPLSFYGSDFQKKVWSALLDIPYGETRTYHQQAVLLGDVLAIRAVASANGKNPIGIVVPCHRVIGSDGSLTGYAGGLVRKRALLELERSHSVRPGTLF